MRTWRLWNTSWGRDQTVSRTLRCGGGTLVRRRRRAWIALGACGVVIILAAAAGWFFWLPAFRPALRAGEAYGIDVSAYQGRIDWRRVAGQQVSFAYIKASEGGDFVDRRFAANWSGAGRAGVPHGAYHFFSLCTPGLAQARNFLRVVPAQPGELAPALDLELSGNCSRRPARRGVETQLKDYLHAVQHAMRQAVVIYLGDDFARWYHLPLLYRHPLWLRSILRRPPPGWIIWQVDGFAHIPGISGRVDLDVGRLPLPAAPT
jgi:lysozyme